MSHLNIEIKAKCSDPERIRKILKDREADFKGLDHQIDTYFNVPSGRMKLREGNIENFLIHYDRQNISGPKESKVTLVELNDPSKVKELLKKALGVLIVVDKEREIYFIDNIKFHIDEVAGLGNFVEIEAIDKNGDIGQDKLYKQCQEYLDLFEVSEKDLVTGSYSDLLK